MAAETIILGAGMSGLGAALSSQRSVYEAAARPGGVCHSFYRTVDGAAREPGVDEVADCFRFEPVGGHWLFGASNDSLERFRRFCTFRQHVRNAAASERSYPAGAPPDAAALAQAVGAIIAELQDWQFIAEALVVEPTFTYPAYTWKWPRSSWVAEATAQLEACRIRQIGRYGAWRFQGMAASFEEGFAAGAKGSA